MVPPENVPQLEILVEFINPVTKEVTSVKRIRPSGPAKMDNHDQHSSPHRKT
jgi:hypothetical protein